MSVPRSHPALTALVDWLPSLDREEAFELVGQDVAERAGRGSFRFASPPEALGHQVAHAQVAGNGSAAETVTVGRGLEGELACRCSCPAFRDSPPCDHVAWMLLALAGSRPLREQVLAGAPGADPVDEPVRPETARAPASREPDRARAIALAREQGVDLDAISDLARSTGSDLLEATFHAWRRRGEIRPLGAATFFVQVEPGDPEEIDAGPSLQVRIQADGDRRPFGPDDLESRRLPAHEWRLFEPLTRPAGGARHFVARGAAITTFLDRAVAAGIDLRADGTGTPIEFREQTLRPALRLRAPNPEEVSAHPVIAARAAEAAEQRSLIREAWRRYEGQVGPLPERRFLEILGAPTEDDRAVMLHPPQILEAVWSTARRAHSSRPSAAATAETADTEPGAASADGIPFTATVLFRGPTSWVHVPAAGFFARVAEDVGPIALARLAAQPTALVPPESADRLPALLREHFRTEGVVLPRREDLGLPALPVPRIVLRVTGTAFSVEAVLEATYGNASFVLAPTTCAHPDDESRNPDSERAAIDVLATTSLTLQAPGRRRRSAPPPADAEPPTWRAEGDRAVDFWTRDLPRLVGEASEAGAIDDVVAPPGLRALNARAPLRAALAANATRSGLIDVALRYAAEGVDADVEEIRQALAAKRRWVKLTDGSVAEISEKIATLAATTRDSFRRNSVAQVPRWAIGEIEAWSELSDEADLDDSVASWTNRLRTIPTGTIEPIAGLKADLRRYQETGVAWLQLLADLGVGGILADDMGLGKTVQALALLAWRRHRDGPSPSLVVAPTSVALNWIREAQRFVPELRPLLLHGADRHARYDEVQNSDLVVTTYALLRRDVSRLRDIAFRYVILDEAQQIKNHAAATTAAAKSLQAGARLALTGTPVENRLLELWSILDFCNPGMLGTWRGFSRLYERPVVEALADAEGEAREAADAEPQAADRTGEGPAGSAGRAASATDEAAALRARIRPFVMRRTKSDVQRDLPPKIESDVVVELTPSQRRAYAALAAAIRADLGPKLSSDGFERHRMLVLTALLRLRQMACDPRLVDPKHPADDSAKLLAFRELISEVIASGRRALVFSQFVELLSLLRRDLDERGVEYAYLDGRTRDRQAVLDAFTSGTMPVFLLSLRAGGTGINLAAADVVIHLDPWWNPAVEDQATDRAHRIGQERTVSVYRIVAAGTIEEAILRLKERKRALASAVIEDTSGEVESLSATDVEDLLRFTG